MTERESIIERLRAVDLGGGSHESLSALAKAIYEPMGGWTIGACEKLRQALVRLLEEAEDVDQGARIIASDEGWDEGYKAGYDAGFASADDWLSQHEDAMAEHGWYRAMDADERPVRIGAAMDSDRYEDGTVVGLQFFNTANKTPRVLIAIRPHGWDTPTWHDPEDYRHHHAPTVEDVLDEFASAYDRIGGEDEEHQKYLNLIAEYAKRLQLREGDES